MESTRKKTAGILALGMILSFGGICPAATHTIAWAPVTAYTDGSPIGEKEVTYSLYWSTSSKLTTLVMFGYGLTGTTKSFDPAVLGMTKGSTVYFTMRTALSSGGTSEYAPPMAWVVPNPSNVSGSSSATSSSTGGTSTASTSAGSTSTGSTSAASSSTGSTSTGSSASSGTASSAKTVLSIPPAPPDDLRIGKRSSRSWRLSWGAVTAYANGLEIPSGRTVRYNAYWTRDPSLAAGNLVPLASSTTALQIDFQPRSQGMKDHEKVYFTLQAILDSGERSDHSGSLPWRVSSRGPAAPSAGRIEIR